MGGRKYDKAASYAPLPRGIVDLLWILPRRFTNRISRHCVYIEQDRLDDAARLLKRSIVITSKASGPDSADIAQAQNSLAEIYSRQGRNADAEYLFKKSAAMYERTLGPDHPELAAVLANLAGFYKDQRRFADAEFYMRRSMAIKARAGSKPI